MTTRKEKKKRPTRNLARRQRRKEYKTMIVTFLLTGGHKDHIPPFSHNWKSMLNTLTSAIEHGNTYYTQPRYSHVSINYTTPQSVNSI
jgi:hypothetical protein